MGPWAHCYTSRGFKKGGSDSTSNVMSDKPIFHSKGGSLLPIAVLSNTSVFFYFEA